MSIKGYKTLTVVLAELVGVLLTGCAMNSGRSMAEFALSTPYRHHDWDWLQSALKAEGVHYMDAGSDLGERWLNVERRDFTRARHIAEKLVTDESLTIRLNKDLAGRVYEVYENGAKVGEESYVVDNPDDLPIPIGKRWNSHDRK